jgi:hypothetical protein
MIDTHEEDRTPEQIQLEIARLQSEKAASEVHLAEQERVARETRESTREIHYNQQFKAEMGKSGIRFEVDDVAELAKLITHTGCTLRSSADGQIIQALDSDGQEIPATKVFEKLALKYPFIVKDDTAAHLRPRDARGAFKSLSKQDFHTTASKVEYIKTFGLDAWEKLGLRSTLGIEQDVDKITAKDWSRMTLAQRSSLIEAHGSAIVSQVLARR